MCWRHNNIFDIPLKWQDRQSLQHNVTVYCYIRLLFYEILNQSLEIFFFILFSLFSKLVILAI